MTYTCKKLTATIARRSWIVFEKGSSTLRLTEDEALALVEFVQARQAWSQQDYDVRPIGWTEL